MLAFQKGGVPLSCLSALGHLMEMAINDSLPATWWHVSNYQSTHKLVLPNLCVTVWVTNHYSPGTQADDGSREIADRLNQEDNRLRVEVYSLRESPNARCLTYAAFLRDDELTKFHTGLPNFKLLNGVFTLVKELVRHSPINALPQFQEFVVTLIRLRLNVPLRDLAFRYCILFICQKTCTVYIVCYNLYWPVSISKGY